MFDEFEKAEDEEQSAIAQRVCQSQTVHATIEEEVLYPAAKGKFHDEDDDMVNGGRGRARLLQGADREDRRHDRRRPEHFKATVKVLSEYIKHHVKEEKNAASPVLKKTDLDLKEYFAARLSACNKE